MFFFSFSIFHLYPKNNSLETMTFDHWLQVLPTKVYFTQQHISQNKDVDFHVGLFRKAECTMLLSKCVKATPAGASNIILVLSWSPTFCIISLLMLVWYGLFSVNLIFLLLHHQLRRCQIDLISMVPCKIILNVIFDPFMSNLQNFKLTVI